MGSILANSMDGPTETNQALLTPEEKKVIRRAIGQNVEIFAATVARLYIAHPSPDRWSYNGSYGAVSLVKDRTKLDAFFFKLVDLNMGKVIWEQELYNELQYRQERPYFHTFSNEHHMTAFSFANEEEAVNFFHKVSHRETLVKKSRLGRNLKWKKKDLNNLTVDDISEPTNFRHIQHIGYNKEKGFDMTNLSPEWKTLLEKAGISNSQLKDKTTAKIVYNFVNEHGGPKAKPSHPPPARPPPPSSLPSENLLKRQIPPPPPVSSKPKLESVKPPPPPSSVRPQERPATLPMRSVSPQMLSKPPSLPPKSMTTGERVSPALKAPEKPTSTLPPSAKISPPPPPPPPPPISSASISPASISPPPPPILPTMSSSTISSNLKEESTPNLSRAITADRSELLSSIRSANMGQLRKISVEASTPSTQTSPSKEEPTDLASALAKALSERSKVLQQSDSEEDMLNEEEDEDDTDW